MNNLRKQAAVKKVNDYMQKPMTQDEALELLKTDESNYTPEELTEIEAFIKAPTNQQQDPPSPPSPDNKSVTQDEAPKAESKPDVKEFDYKNLTGDAFKKYVKLAGDRSYMEVDKETGSETPVVGELKENDSFTYELYPVDVVMKPRFPGVKDTPYDFNGVKIKAETPIQTTKIPVKVALELNAQILNAHSRAGHGRYYLLKK